MGLPAAVSAASLKPDESVVIFPTIGWQTPKGWEIEIHGLVYESRSHKLMTSALRRALGVDEEDLQPGEAALFAERARYFLNDNERRKRVTIQFGDRRETISPTAANGHFRASFSVPRSVEKSNSLAQWMEQRIVTLQTYSENTRIKPTQGHIYLVASNGLSIISDIDDTIKISVVTNRHELIRNTFFRPFKAVPGMADLYRTWSTNQGTSFHYLSASPWQLYVPLSDFIRGNGFPAGSFHLKQFRVKDRSALDLFQSPLDYKPSVIEDLLKKFPHRRFILVGDSGEKDPEIYGSIARKHPGQIIRIFIRDVTGEPSQSDRYRKAFDKIPPHQYQLFRSPSEIIFPGS